MSKDWLIQNVSSVLSSNLASTEAQAHNPQFFGHNLVNILLDLQWMLLPKIGFQYVLQWCCLVTSVPYPTQNEPKFFPESHPEFVLPFYPKRPCALRAVKRKHTIISWSFNLDKAILARDLHSFSERAQILKHLSLILTILPSYFWAC